METASQAVSLEMPDVSDDDKLLKLQDHYRKSEAEVKHLRRQVKLCLQEKIKEKEMEKSRLLKSASWFSARETVSQDIFASSAISSWLVHL